MNIYSVTVLRSTITLAPRCHLSICRTGWSCYRPRPLHYYSPSPNSSKHYCPRIHGEAERERESSGRHFNRQHDGSRTHWMTTTHLGKIPNVIGVEQELLQAARISENVLGHGGQGAVALVHKLHLPIAALEYWNALEHGCELLIPHQFRLF